VEARIHKVLDSAIILLHGASPDPSQRGIASVRVSTLDTISATFTILSFHCARVFAQGLVDGHGELQDAFPSMEAPQLEVSQAFHRAMQTREER
jgi:hypothetical protein